MKHPVRYRFEAAALRIWFALCRRLGLDRASDLGAAVLVRLGPWLSRHQRALNNLALVMPELGPAQQEEIVRGMWRHLGRVAAEMAFLGTGVLQGRVALKGAENVPRGNGAAICISAHLGNWELFALKMHAEGLPCALVYRHANNPLVDQMLLSLRGPFCVTMVPKHRGAIKLARAIKQGYVVAMLVDQKMNNGVSARFFGRPAMTAPSVADLALRQNLPVIPARMLRLNDSSHFELTVFPALDVERTGDFERDRLAILERINAIMESWIREHPEQWLWTHRRWPESR